jgi:hypothetical protein
VAGELSRAGAAARRLAGVDTPWAAPRRTRLAVDGDRTGARRGGVEDALLLHRRVGVALLGRWGGGGGCCGGGWGMVS